MDSIEARQRLRALFQRKLETLRAQEPDTTRPAEVQRSEIVEELAGMQTEEEAVELAVAELRTNWHVDPVNGWVFTRNNTRFLGAFFMDYEGYRRHHDLP